MDKAWEEAWKRTRLAEVTILVLDCQLSVLLRFSTRSLRSEDDDDFGKTQFLGQTFLEQHASWFAFLLVHGLDGSRWL